MYRVYNYFNSEKIFRTIFIWRIVYVGFMCHQTIEKALKAVISSMSEEDMPSYTHNPIKLAREADLN